MSTTIKVKTVTEVEVTHLQVDAGVRYWEDGTVNGTEDETGELIPCRNGDRWKPLIELATGKIIDWPQGTIANVHYKVCDDGIYTLLDAEGDEVKKIDDYVPEMLNTEDGDSDYIVLMIDENGIIQNWDIDVREWEVYDDE